MLRKSKGDCRIDAALREKAYSQDFFDQEIYGIDVANLDSDDNDSSPEDLSSDSLIAAYDSIAKSWHKECTVADRIPNLSFAIGPAPVLQSQSFVPLDISQHPSHASSRLPPTTLQEWQLQIKSIVKLEDPDEGPGLGLDDFDIDSGYGIYTLTLAMNRKSSIIHTAEPHLTVLHPVNLLILSAGRKLKMRVLSTVSSTSSSHQTLSCTVVQLQIAPVKQLMRNSLTFLISAESTVLAGIIVMVFAHRRRVRLPYRSRKYSVATSST